MPFAFHCTGMPISAAAKKLGRDLEILVKLKKLYDRIKVKNYQKFLNIKH